MKLTKLRLKRLIKEEARQDTFAQALGAVAPDLAQYDMDQYGGRGNLEPYRELAEAALAIPRGIDVHGELEEQLKSTGYLYRGQGIEDPVSLVAMYYELDMGNLINQFGEESVARKVDALIRLMIVADADPQGRAMLDAVYDERPDLEPGGVMSKGVLDTPAKRSGVEEFSEGLQRIIDEELDNVIEEMRLSQGARYIDEYGMEEDFMGEGSMDEGYLEEDFFSEGYLEEDEGESLESRLQRLEDAMLG